MEGEEGLNQVSDIELDQCLKSESLDYRNQTVSVFDLRLTGYLQISKTETSSLSSDLTHWKFLMFEISRKISAENSSVILVVLIYNQCFHQFGISRIYFGYIV